jgi:hypothetical protein
MDHGRAQSLRRSFFEISQHPIDTADVHPHVTLRDPVSSLPPPFVFGEPVPLLGGE